MIQPQVRSPKRWLVVVVVVGLLECSSSLAFSPSPSVGRSGRIFAATSNVADSASSTSPDAKASQDPPPTSISLFSPCKINLFLRIIRKRPDGYHDLASLFQAIGFGDKLELSKLDANDEGDEFTCNMEGVPTDSSNLVLRALQLMREKTGMTQQRFRANLIKQVPAQAGLGGGSANAATAMWGANELMGRPATLEQVRLPWLTRSWNRPRYLLASFSHHNLMPFISTISMHFSGTCTAL